MFLTPKPFYVLTQISPVFLSLKKLTPAFVYPLADVRYIYYIQKKILGRQIFQPVKITSYVNYLQPRYYFFFKT